MPTRVGSARPTDDPKKNHDMIRAAVDLDIKEVNSKHNTLHKSVSKLDTRVKITEKQLPQIIPVIMKVAPAFADSGLAGSENHVVIVPDDEANPPTAILYVVADGRRFAFRGSPA